MFCTECGKELHDGDKFCGNCGAKVKGREKETEEPASPFQEIVFNPPFKREAERRTAEINREIQASTREESEKERSSFQWNLDGFPSIEPRKTEAIDFNWDSVVDRHNRRLEAEALQKKEAPEAGATEEPVSPKVQADLQHAAEQIQFHEEQPFSEIKETEEELFFKTPVMKEEEEKPLTTEELEKELFEKEYTGLGQHGSDDALKNTAQLEKFYTYNQKKEAFQELLDKEYERLKGMEEERKPDEASLEYTWAAGLFPDKKPVSLVKTEKNTTVENDGNAELQTAERKNEPEAISFAEMLQEDIPTEPVTDATIDFSNVREAARQKKAATMAIPMTDDLISEDVIAESVPAQADTPEEAVQTAEAVSDQTEYEEVSRTTEEKSEETIEDPAETVPVQSETDEVQEDAAEEKTEPEKESQDEVTPSSGEKKQEDPEQDTAAQSHGEKSRLRYSDIFPREEICGDSHDDASIDADNSAALTNIGEDDDEEEEPPKKMNLFVKIILIILAVLILLEGTIIIAKFVAPESAFSVKANEIVESLMDRLTGGDGEVKDPDDIELDTPVNTNSYISDILNEMNKPATIGQVLEDGTLKYDLSKTYAFEQIGSSKEFTDSDWILEGETTSKQTYAEGILSALVAYYDKWQESNEDLDLIGINKLEIGEIRTGGEGYYVLYRLTFAGADGTDVVKYETAYVIISQDTMVINEIKEEAL